MPLALLIRAAHGQGGKQGRTCVLFAIICCLLLFRTAAHAERTHTPSSDGAMPPHLCVHDAMTAAEREGAQRRVYARLGSQTHSPSAGVQPATQTTNTAEWQPIRITAFAKDLEDSSRYCTEVGQSRPDFAGKMVQCTSTADVMTEQKKKTLLQSVLPYAIEQHAKRLLVQPIQSNETIVVNQMRGLYCGSFTVPEAHQTSGVAGSDFVVYVAAGPTSTPTSFVAWALTCQYHPQTNRPLVGVMYFNPRYISDDPDGASALISSGGDASNALDKYARTVMHELLHALGFSFNFFNSLGMVRLVRQLRGKSNVLVVNTTAVRRAAIAHYGCDEAFPGMELEDEGAGGTSGSHWKRRNAKDELMSPVSGFARYTDITTAAMEDTGKYKANNGFGEFMSWGYQQGCKLIKEKCVQDGDSREPSMFCSDFSGMLTCSSDRLSVGACSVTIFDNNLPSYFQYFTNPKFAGAASYVDYCPIVQPYVNTACSGGEAGVMPGSVIANTARCIDADELITKSDFNRKGGVCVDVRCNETTKAYHVRVSGAARWVLCTPGSSIEPAATSANTFQRGGMLNCPRYEEVCQQNPNAFVSFQDGDSQPDSGALGCRAPVLRLSRSAWGVTLYVSQSLLIAASLAIIPISVAFL